ncbi:MAG: hypothetical protein ACLUN0_11060 [Roseburia sp.]
MADYILADAKSGAAMEAAYLNNTVPLALLTVREPVEDWFYPEIEKLGPVVTAKDSLTEKMAECQVEKIGKNEKNFGDLLWKAGLSIFRRRLSII